MSYLNSFVVDPRDFDDDDDNDDWLNDDFDDLKDKVPDTICPNLKTLDQDINNTDDDDDDDDDDAFREVLQLNQIGYCDRDGNSYCHQVQVSSTAFHVQQTEQGQIISEMTERLVNVSMDETDADDNAHADMSDEELRLLDDLYRKQHQCRIAEANKNWGFPNAPNTIQVNCQPGETAIEEFQNAKASKVQFATDVQYFYSTDASCETEEMTAHELMLLKEKSGDSMDTTADEVSYVEYVNMSVFQPLGHQNQDSGSEKNGNSAKSTIDTKFSRTFDVQICKLEEHGDHQRLQDSRPSSSTAQLLKYSDLQISSKAEFYIPPSREATPLKVLDTEDTVSKLKNRVNPILRSVLDPKLLKMLCKAPAQNVALIKELNVQIQENLAVIQRAKLPSETLKLLDELSRIGTMKKQQHKSAKASASFGRSTFSSQMRVAGNRRSKQSDKKPFLEAPVQNIKSSQPTKVT